VNHRGFSRHIAALVTLFAAAVLPATASHAAAKIQHLISPGGIEA
jgi:hypothetical protein